MRSVSHVMITSGIPSEWLGICFSSTYLPRGSPGPFDWVRRPGRECTCLLLTRRDLVARVCGPGVRQSQFPVSKGSPSRRPSARGASPRVTGGPERLTGISPNVGPGCCPSQSWRWQPRVVGGSAESKGVRAAHAGRTRGRVREAVWQGWATQAVRRGAKRGAPSGAAVARASLEGQTRGGAGGGAAL